MLAHSIVFSSSGVKYQLSWIVFSQINQPTHPSVNINNSDNIHQIQALQYVHAVPLHAFNFPDSDITVDVRMTIHEFNTSC